MEQQYHIRHMIIIFCGVPGAGKTTIANKLIPKLKGIGSVQSFTSDELRPPVYKKFFTLLSQNLGKSDFLIFDATFYKKAHREKIKALAKREKILTIFVDVSLKTALLRNRRRKVGIPERGVRALFDRMEKPTRPDLHIDTERMSAQAASDTIFRLIARHKKKIVPKKRRIFIAFGISEALQGSIIRWEKKYKKIAGGRVRWLAGKNLHITLIPPWYATDIEKVKSKIEKAIGAIRPFDIAFTTVACGPDARRPRLIWATGEAPQDALRLKEKLEKRLKQKGESRPWLAHLTIARFRPSADSAFALKDFHEEIHWKERVSALVLMESHLSPKGAEYEVLHRVDFR